MNAKSFVQQFLSSGTFLVIAYASYLLILLSVPYIDGESHTDFLASKQLIYHIKVWRYSFYIHVFTSPLVIVAGLLQFNRWVLGNWPKVHKTAGYVYTIVVLFISGPSAFVMALMANGSYPAQISFTTIALLWIFFTYMGYHHIRRGNVRAHLIWNLLSYSLTLSAVTQRLYVYLLKAYGPQIGQVEAYVIISYLSWIPNLLFAYGLILLKYPEYLMKYRKLVRRK
ncbi:MAG: hypothetical protein DCO96_15310 [Fluviicola sp. XM-24bin1]|nr:MAG: hypothetical protein DCO96_15310 [Fluviicola sp. XM-24bin1]